MLKQFFLVFSFAISFTNLSAQIKIINNSDFNYQAVYITPSKVGLKTKGSCFEILEKRINQSDLNKNGKITINYKFKKGTKYDLFLIDTMEDNSYKHSACLHSISFDKSSTVTIVNDSVPRPFYYHCMERIMNDNEVSLILNFTNNSKFRVLELSYAIDKLDNFTTHRYLVPWSPLQTNKSIKCYLTHLKKDGVEKDLMLKIKLESNGVFKEKIISLKFTEEIIDYTFSE